MSITTAPSSLWTVAALPLRAAAEHAERPALRFQRGGDWHDVSYAALLADVEQVALGLIGLGVAAGDRVCILADTRPEWTVVDLAVAATGAIAVPIYPTSSPEECAWVIRDSGAAVVVCGNAAQLETVRSLRDDLPDIGTVVVIDAAGVTSSDGLRLDELRATAVGQNRAELDRRIAAVRPEDPFTFVYTSGTTGPPKGCILTHDNFRFVCETLRDITVIEPGDRVYLYLPLAHVFARLVQLGTLLLGATLVYFSGDLQRLVPELAEVRPTYLPSVPRIFEKLYTLATAAAATPEERAKLRGAVELGLEVRNRQARGEAVPADMQQAFDAADAAVFAKVRAIFGGQLKEAVTGAAPIAPEILKFFFACGVPVLEGFGMTETAAAATTSTLADHRFGTVGRALPGTQMRIADDGEILIAGPHVFAGYHGDNDAINDTVIDGWLHTGDLGDLDDDGHLTITGRKKDIIITSGGKNLSPANLENALRQSRWISHAVMYGDRRPYAVALLTLDADEITTYARSHGLPEDVATLTDLPQVQALIEDVVAQANAMFSTAQQIKRFAILDHDFSVESGELTPTLKLKRRVVHERHAERFEGLYA